MTNRFNPLKNPSTNKKWLLKDLLIETQKLDNRLSKLESATNLEYSWPRICKEAQSLIIEQAKADTKKVTRSLWKDAKSVYSELSFELVNHPSK